MKAIMNVLLTAILLFSLVPENALAQKTRYDEYKWYVSLNNGQSVFINNIEFFDSVGAGGIIHSQAWFDVYINREPAGTLISELITALKINKNVTVDLSRTSSNLDMLENKQYRNTKIAELQLPDFDVSATVIAKIRVKIETTSANITINNAPNGKISFSIGAKSKMVQASNFRLFFGGLPCQFVKKASGIKVIGVSPPGNYRTNSTILPTTMLVEVGGSDVNKWYEQFLQNNSGLEENKLDLTIELMDATMKKAIVEFRFVRSAITTAQSIDNSVNKVFEISISDISFKLL